MDPDADKCMEIRKNYTFFQRVFLSKTVIWYYEPERFGPIECPRWPVQYKFTTPQKESPVLPKFDVLQQDKSFSSVSKMFDAYIGVTNTQSYTEPIVEEQKQKFVSDFNQLCDKAWEKIQRLESIQGHNLDAIKFIGHYSNTNPFVTFVYRNLFRYSPSYSSIWVVQHGERAFSRYVVDYTVMNVESINPQKTLNLSVRPAIESGYAVGSFIWEKISSKIFRTN